MIKKEITYTNYNNETKTRTYCFHISETEVKEKGMRWDAEKMSDKLHEMFNAKDVEGLYYFFKDLVLDSFGIKSEDGDRFIKNAELREAFSQSAAFDVLLDDLMSSDENTIIEFMKGIMPERVRKQVEEQEAKVLPGPGAAPIDGVVKPE